VAIWKKLRKVTFVINWTHCQKHLAPNFDSYESQVFFSSKDEVRRIVTKTIQHPNVLRPCYLKNSNYSFKGVKCIRKFHARAVGRKRDGSKLFTLNVLITFDADIRTIYAS